jgi:hypothetical protein
VILEASYKVKKWDIFEIELKGPDGGNPFIEVTLSGVFKFKDRTLEAEGFYDGNGIYKIRLMPDAEGTWTYVTKSSDRDMDGIEGAFVCTNPKNGNHGPVGVANTYHFVYQDGTPYYPVGTTCYAWIHQEPWLQEQTLYTLKSSPFNKIRMCVFPKHYDYNHNEPEIFPFEGSLTKGWDYTRFNPMFFKHLEKRIDDLKELGIEADLILFHPYDRWGFSKMGTEADNLYVHYIVKRLAAYRNIWWSLANEYDLMNIFTKSKTNEDWERIAGIIVEKDPYGHLRSIHNCMEFYDHSRPWITHCSIQRQDVYKTSEYTNEWRDKYKKPVVIDECAYEGNISGGWGNITGAELVRRCWEGAVRGGYVGHGETYINPEEILWWSKGGILHGESPDRIRFLKKILEEGPTGGLSLISFGLLESWDLPCGGVPEEYYLFYFGFNQPTFRTFNMPEGNQYRVEIIDAWNMTIHEVEGIFEGEFRIDLPGEQYMAIRMRKIH